MEQWCISASPRSLRAPRYYSPEVRLFCALKPAAPALSENKTESSTTGIYLTWTEGALYQASLLEYKVYANDGLGGDLAHVATVVDSSQRYYR